MPADATETFVALLHEAGPDLPLDRAALLVAAHDHPLDVDARLREIDALAAAAPAGGSDVLARFLFGELGFAGNRVDYGDPRNSYLDAVLDRKLGIPISLSVLMIEVGRRRGIALDGVGMPGHFLVGTHEHGDPVWYDAFDGGARLDVAGCVERFAAIRPREEFRRDFLRPVTSRAILDRMLSNLQVTFLAREPRAVAWPVRLRLAFPDRPPAERAELGGVLAQVGRFDEAAVVLEDAATDLPDERGDRLRVAVHRLRARGN